MLDSGGTARRAWEALGTSLNSAMGPVLARFASKPFRASRPAGWAVLEEGKEKK
jgi:hypothetical protein